MAVPGGWFQLSKSWSRVERPGSCPGAYPRVSVRLSVCPSLSECCDWERGATLEVLQRLLQRGFESRTSRNRDLCPGRGDTGNRRGSRQFLGSSPHFGGSDSGLGEKEGAGGVSSRDYGCYKKHQHLSPLFPKALGRRKRDLKSNLLH